MRHRARYQPDLSLSSKVRTWSRTEAHPTQGYRRIVKKNKKLKNDSSCTYNVRLKAKKSSVGKAVNAELLITGKFGPNYAGINNPVP